MQSCHVLLSEQNVYNVKGSSRGRAVIISNEYFTDSKLTARFGNGADVMNLKKLLHSLHFQVDTWHDKTEEVIDNFQRNTFSVLVMCMKSFRLRLDSWLHQ